MNAKFSCGASHQSKGKSLAKVVSSVAESKFAKVASSVLESKCFTKIASSFMLESKCFTKIVSSLALESKCLAKIASSVVLAGALLVGFTQNALAIGGPSGKTHLQGTRQNRRSSRQSLRLSPAYSCD